MPRVMKISKYKVCNGGRNVVPSVRPTPYEKGVALCGHFCKGSVVSDYRRVLQTYEEASTCSQKYRAYMPTRHRNN